MTDYTGNSRKAKEEAEAAAGETEVPDKKVQKVVVGEVVVRKKPLGRKIRDLIIEADFRGVGRHIIMGVLIPAAKNMMVDSVESGIRRIAYGENAMRGRGYSPGPRITYNNPINRTYQAPGPPRTSVEVNVGPRNRSRHERGEFILNTRDEASTVLERMNDIIDNYQVVSVADLNELVGFPSTHVDNKWGWVYLGDVQIRQIREGYLIDLPPAEPIQ